jgi:hypothetical protein
MTNGLCAGYHFGVTQSTKFPIGNLIILPEHQNGYILSPYIALYGSPC